MDPPEASPVSSYTVSLKGACGDVKSTRTNPSRVTDPDVPRDDTTRDVLYRKMMNSALVLMYMADSRMSITRFVLARRLLCKSERKVTTVMTDKRPVCTDEPI